MSCDHMVVYPEEWPKQAPDFMYVRAHCVLCERHSGWHRTYREARAELYESSSNAALRPKENLQMSVAHPMSE